MKETIIVAILIFLSANVCGQHMKIKPGIRAGVALANSRLTFADNFSSPDPKMKVGLLGGGFLNIYLKDNLILQPGVHYIRKGYRDRGYGDRYYNYSVNYFEFPVNIVFKPGKKSSPYFFGGGLSPALNSKRDDDYSQEKKFDLGLNVLAGYGFPIGFSINFGYTHGLLNVAANRVYIKEIYNRNFFGTVAYEF